MTVLYGVAKHRAKCKVCERMIEPGQRIQTWGQSWCHVNCPEPWTHRHTVHRRQGSPDTRKVWHRRADSPCPSPEEVTAAQTPGGGWTRKTLAGWGVPWPPPKKWRDRLAAEWTKKNPAPKT